MAGIVITETLTWYGYIYVTMADEKTCFSASIKYNKNHSCLQL